MLVQMAIAHNLPMDRRWMPLERTAISYTGRRRCHI